MNYDCLHDYLKPKILDISSSYLKPTKSEYNFDYLKPKLPDISSSYLKPKKDDYWPGIGRDPVRFDSLSSLSYGSQIMRQLNPPPPVMPRPPCYGPLF